MEPSLNSDRPLSLADLYFAVIRYRRRAFKSSILLMILASAVVCVLPKRYESEAKLFVRLGRGSVTLDPAATTGQTISIQESRETEINSVVDMLQSRGIAERVVNSVGAERVLAKHSWVERKIEWLQGLIPSLPAGASAAEQENAKVLTGEELEAQEKLEMAIKDLHENMQIKSPRKSTTISIAFRGSDPYLAQDVNRAIIEAYKQLHIIAYKADGSLEFFEEKFNQQSEILIESQEALRYAKNEMMIITIHGKQESLQQQITENQKTQLDVRSELIAAKARVSELQRDMLALPSEVPTAVTTGADASSDSMRSRLFELEIQEQELASKYSDDHPTLQKVRVQLASSRKTYEEQQKESDQSVVSSNPVREKQHSELLAARAAMYGLEAKQTALLQTADELRERLEKVNRFEMESDSLQRKIDIARETYQVYARKLEESRINQALDIGSQSNVSVVQEPSLAVKHTSPKRSMLFALAAVLSSIGGITVAVLSDRLQLPRAAMQLNSPTAA
jgi:uncharacterized protein involved in exopolysaccharide biosynthesis